MSRLCQRRHYGIDPARTSPSSHHPERHQDFAGAAQPSPVLALWPRWPYFWQPEPCGVLRLPCAAEGLRGPRRGGTNNPGKGESGPALLRPPQKGASILGRGRGELQILHGIAQTLHCNSGRRVCVHTLKGQNLECSRALSCKGTPKQVWVWDEPCVLIERASLLESLRGAHDRTCSLRYIARACQCGSQWLRQGLVGA